MIPFGGLYVKLAVQHRFGVPTQRKSTENLDGIGGLQELPDAN
jgi:hypothetical protein